MKGTGAKRNVCPGSCVSTGAKFPVAPVESAPMCGHVEVTGGILCEVNHCMKIQMLAILTTVVYE